MRDTTDNQFLNPPNPKGVLKLMLALSRGAAKTAAPLISLDYSEQIPVFEALPLQ